MNLIAKIIFRFDPLTMPGDIKYFSHKKGNHQRHLKIDEIDGIHYLCPCGCDSQRKIQFEKPGLSGWKWDENINRPTLNQSIRHHVSCDWHGFLKAGVWVSC